MSDWRAVCRIGYDHSVELCIGSDSRSESR